MNAGFFGAPNVHRGQSDPTSWPPRTGSSPTLKYDGKIFETKFAQEQRNQFDGVKGGEAWKMIIRGYPLGKPR